MFWFLIFNYPETACKVSSLSLSTLYNVINLVTGINVVILLLKIRFGSSIKNNLSNRKKFDFILILLKLINLNLNNYKLIKLIN